MPDETQDLFDLTVAELGYRGALYAQVDDGGGSKCSSCSLCSSLTTCSLCIGGVAEGE
jgi:hypothetical protein